jgi:hypothetical protein
MRAEKLDPPLRALVSGRGDLAAPVLVSIRLVDNARKEDLQRLSELVNDRCDGLPVVTGELSSEALSKVSENAAVLAIRLSRRLRPLRA